MQKQMSTNPLLFGLFLTTLHKKWAIPANIFVFVATAIGRYIVVLLGNLTDAIAAKPLVMETVWMWAIAYPLLFFVVENIWRLSGFTGMRWFMNFRFSGYQLLYEYLSLHSKDYFNSRFAGSLANKITHAVDGTQALFEKMLWQFMPLLLGLIWFTVFAFLSDFRLGLAVQSPP